MATTHESHPTGPRRPPRSPRLKRSGIFRWTAEQAYYLADQGFFDDRHVELIGGILYEMTINPPHAVCTDVAAEVFRRLIPAGYCVRVYAPLDLGRRSLPEPDIAVVTGVLRDYLRSHPRTASLAVEVSDSTLRKDRTIKVHLYAKAGLEDYWIINLIDSQLEIHRDPGPDPSRKGRFRYGDVQVISADGHATPLAFPGVAIAVADLLP